MPFPPLAEPYYHKQPRYNTLDYLFEHCVKFAAQNHHSGVHTHQQWATLLFGYERNSGNRSSLMTRVHSQFGIYFIGDGFRYDFDTELIAQNYPQWFEGYQPPIPNPTPDPTDPIRTILDTVVAVKQEKTQSQNPCNRESYRVLELDEHAFNDHYIYAAHLQMSDGSDPHFREGLQVQVNNGQRYTVEVVEFDYVNGILYFTSRNRIYMHYGSTYINVDQSFILEGLLSRIIALAQDGIAKELPVYKFIIGTTDQLATYNHLPAPESVTAGLDLAQLKAFNAALDHDITLIWGPPGTGKSYTLAAIIRAFFCNYFFTKERTIVCCVSNVAVDQLVNKVVDLIEHDQWHNVAPGDFYRAGRTLDERIIATDYLFPNDATTKEYRQQIEQLKMRVERFTLLDEKGFSNRIIELKAQIKDLRTQLKEHTDYLVNNARIVFSTISNFVLSERINQSDFDNLIVDEASMLALPSLLALAKKVKKRIILVGDFQQLCPIALVPNPLLKRNVFARCGIDINHTTHPALHLLLNQRRSHEDIVRLINHTFYNDQLVATIHGTNDIILADPFPGKVVIKMPITDGTMRYTKGGTRQNVASAEAIFALLDQLQDTLAPNISIGIITPYKGQANLLRALKAERDYPVAFDDQIRIGTVHTFQGSECDIIIFDIVDCRNVTNGKSPCVGKIYNGKEGEQLLNVAISRARHKLIVVGDIDWFINFAPGNSVTTNTLGVLRKIK